MALDVPFNGTLGVCSLSLFNDAFFNSTKFNFLDCFCISKTRNCIQEYTFDDALTVAKSFGGNPGWNSDAVTSSDFVGLKLEIFYLEVTLLCEHNLKGLFWKLQSLQETFRFFTKFPEAKASPRRFHPCCVSTSRF